MVLESLGSVLAGLALMVLIGACLVGYVVWREARRSEDGHDAG